MEIKTGRRNKCPICGQKYRGVIQHYKGLRLWIESIVQSTRGDSYQDTVLKIRDRILFPEECFCEGKIVDEWNSSLRTILGMRFENLLQNAGTKDSKDARKDCWKEIFEKAC